MQGLRETEGREWPRYQLRLFRLGMRAAADLAAVARARRDAAGEEAAIRSGDGLWAALQPVLATISARSRGREEENEAELATIVAERARLANEPAVSLWADAAQHWRVCENGYLVAYCAWRQAEALLGDGDRAAAAVALVEAHGIATGLGARPLTSSIEGLAARSRVDLSVDGRATVTTAGARDAAEDPFGLTRRERDVLPLLVKGRTNRQIAEELFISENTAGVHVSNILGKLGATTRTEAAGIAARLGLGAE
jgi:DNA-binding CsgD family transcriptional regulator